ncbi:MULTISPECIES: tripartite tricarboxylate transporter substrate binding protein [unclassified Bordetella]|uniref:Bug family tripartite tricarboxylate transporter substrate binding protein n=1 Tax=unclassified Bordetella TaxID=2630031 RepID=UPI001EF0D55A|nr:MULTISPECIES: tripartite tricarboxylate transporter substrate binding protein [unclassified Bordetella]
MSILKKAGRSGARAMVRSAAILAGALAISFGSAAQASDYPNGPVTLVIPFSAGGSTDVIGRLIGDRLSTALKQPVVVENRGGAGGNIGAAMVAKSAPDGRTLLFGTTGILSMNHALYAKPGYTVGEDLIPVVYTASIGNVLIVNNDLPVNSAEELLKLVKENPGKYTFASSGAGSSTHMSGELFKNMGGVDIMHVPYRGSGQALVDLMGGQVHMIFDNAPSSVPLVKTGKVKALAVTSKDRLAALPDTPTIAETVLPGYESLSWTGVAVPGGTPQEIVDRLNSEINKILQQPDVQAKLADLGAKVTGGTQQDFNNHIAAEREKWSKIIAGANIPKQ